jgi:glycosyltransferase involved in cell wall biosynthesis
VDKFNLIDSKQNFYMTASFMNPFKKIDLIVEAFAELPNQKLIVIGDGPEYKRIQAKATSNVQLLGYRKTDELKYYMQQAKAFIFAAPEDFGIVMAEAQACGTPVIAYERGGATEIVRGLEQNNPTGVLFPKQTASSILQAIKQFEQSCKTISLESCRQNALRFSPSCFQKSFHSIVYKEWFRTRQKE